MVVSGWSTGWREATTITTTWRLERAHGTSLQDLRRTIPSWTRMRSRWRFQKYLGNDESFGCDFCGSCLIIYSPAPFRYSSPYSLTDSCLCSLSSLSYQEWPQPTTASSCGWLMRVWSLNCKHDAEVSWWGATWKSVSTSCRPRIQPSGASRWVLDSTQQASLGFSWNLSNALFMNLLCHWID